MCSPAKCRRCGKKTWSGCGKHVDAVMAGVPAEQQCTCKTASAGKVVSGSTGTPRTTAAGEHRSWWRFGR